MSLARLPAFDREADAYRTVIEAVKGSRNKFKFEPRLGLFVHNGVLPAGASYPFDYGYIPGTKGEDGDPIDVLVLMDEPAYVGAIVPARVVGAIEAEQEEDSGFVRNDRLLAVACKSRLYRDIMEINDLPATLVEEVEHFWVSYNALKTVKFRPLGRAGSAAAVALVTAAIRAARPSRRGRG